MEQRGQASHLRGEDLLLVRPIFRSFLISLILIIYCAVMSCVRVRVRYCVELM